MAGTHSIRLHSSAINTNSDTDTDAQQHHHHPAARAAAAATNRTLEAIRRLPVSSSKRNYLYLEAIFIVSSNKEL